MASPMISSCAAAVIVGCTLNFRAAALRCASAHCGGEGHAPGFVSGVRRAHTRSSDAQHHARPSCFAPSLTPTTSPLCVPPWLTRDQALAREARRKRQRTESRYMARQAER